MSRKRQNPIFDPQGKPSAQLTTLSYDFKDGYVVPEHFHDEDQVVFAAKGVMTIRTVQGIWMVPPLRAVWIPGREVHSIAMSGSVLMRTLYFAPRFARSMPKKCFVLNVSPLLRELIFFACNQPVWKFRIPMDRRVIEIIVDQLASAKAVPLQLPQPRDPRAMRVVEFLLKSPSDSRTLRELCRKSGASKRTIERIFVEETAMTLGKWRQQLRLLHAMRLLASGEKILTVALESGYNSPSAFISLFRKSLGQTPNKYFARERHRLE
jgi:AraC-like DNA-binding protein